MIPIAFPMPIMQDTPAMTSKLKCRVPGCPREMAVQKHRLCRPHYKRWIRSGSVGSPAIREKRSYRPYSPKKKAAVAGS